MGGNAKDKCRNPNNTKSYKIESKRRSPIILKRQINSREDFDQHHGTHNVCDLGAVKVLVVFEFFKLDELITGVM